MASSCVVGLTTTSLLQRCHVSPTNHAAVWWQVVARNRYASSSARQRRLQKLGIGPDGKPLPIPNTRKLFPCMYPVLVVNQDGSSYNIRHTTPHRIITLPLDPDTLSEEERIAREKDKKRAKMSNRPVIEEFDEEEEEWGHGQYKDLLR